jgi:hypothetical protein
MMIICMRAAGGSSSAAYTQHHLCVFDGDYVVAGHSFFQFCGFGFNVVLSDLLPVLFVVITQHHSLSVTFTFI